MAQFPHCRSASAIQTADAALPHTYALLGLVVVGLIALAVVRVAPLVRS